MLTLADILEALTNTHLNSDDHNRWGSLTVSEAVIDSRQVIPASMFVALPGERTDGHRYINEAFARGAILALVQKDLSDQYKVVDLRRGSLQDNLPLIQQNSNDFSPICLRVDDSLKALQTIASFWRRKLNLRVIGITGSVGKSTTKEVVASILSQRYRTLKNPGNLNNEIGLPLTLLRLGKGHQRAVLEMGFYVPGEIAFLCNLALPEIGIVTNIGTVHAERAGSQETIALGKSELVQALPAAPRGIAILNYDDPFVRSMAEKTRARVIFYGLDPKAHIWADNIKSEGLQGISLVIHYNHENIPVHVPMIGRHSVHTVLRAAAVGLAEDLTVQEIITGLQSATTHLRLVAVHTDNGALLLDDTYNASPESVLAALDLFSEIPASTGTGRKIAVLGDMYELGPYEQSGHEKVGNQAASICEKLITVGKQAKMIADGASLAGMNAADIIIIPTVSEAIEFLRQFLQEGDVVLLKGGHSLRMDRITSALEKNPKLKINSKVTIKAN